MFFSNTEKHSLGTREMILDFNPKIALKHYEMQ